MSTTATTNGAHATTTTQGHSPQWLSRVVMLSVGFSLAQIFQELISEVTFSRPAHPQATEPTTGETATMYALFQVVGTAITARVMLSFRPAAGSGGTEKDLISPHTNTNANTNNPSGDAKPPLPIVASLSALVFASTALANWALDFIVFPAKVVVKSAKLVPTMVVSVMMGNSGKFAAVDYVAAILLCAGAAGFALASGTSNSPAASAVAEVPAPVPGVGVATNVVSAPESVTATTTDGVAPPRSTAWIGLLMLVMATTADALVPNLQQKTMRQGVSAEQLALSVNVFGAVSIFVALVLSGSLSVWMAVWTLDATSLVLMLLGGICTGVGVMSYTFLIAEAGSVTAVVVSTLRKVVTIILSFALLPRPDKTFGAVHAVSTVLVALGMGLQPLLERLRSSCHSRGWSSSAPVGYAVVPSGPPKSDAV